MELVKDCGLIPYLLYKNHNCNVSLVGAWLKLPYTHLQESCFQTVFPQRIEYSQADHVNIIIVQHFKSPRNRPMPDPMEEIL